MIDARNLPDDLATCQRMLVELSQAHQRLQEVYQELLDTCTSMQDSQQRLHQEKSELELTIKELMNRLYGRRSERQTVSPDQLSFDFGEGEFVEVLPDVSEDEKFVAEYEGKKKQKRGKQKRTGRFPAHIERRTERIDPVLPEGVRLEDCELIGVDVVEVMEFERSRQWIRQIELPKYKVRTRPDLKILQARQGYSLISGGSYGFGMAAEVLFNKFAMHVPLYRQQDLFTQCGWSPNRSTLCQLVVHSAELLSPLVSLMTTRVLSLETINTDDTEVTLLTPGQGKGSRKARLWIYHGREGSAPYDVFAFTDSRARAGPDEFLRDFEGTICGDCYSGYVNIEDVTGGRIAFSACNAHARRYVHNARELHPELASEIAALYHLLYDIEERGRRLDPVERLLLRRRESVPLMKRLEQLIHGDAARKLLPKNKLGQAIGYLRNNWPALTRFLSDARLPIDNNDAEAHLRRVALGRKNWLFVGSENGGERTATILSIVASAHRHHLDEWAYLRDVLEKLAKGEVELEQLLPDVWKTQHPEHVRDFREEELQDRAEERRYHRANRRIKAVKARRASTT